MTDVGLSKAEDILRQKVRLDAGHIVISHFACKMLQYEIASITSLYDLQQKMILQISVNGSRFRKIMRQHDTVSVFAVEFAYSSNKRDMMTNMSKSILFFPKSGIDIRAFDIMQDRTGRLTAKQLKKALDLFGVSLSSHDVRAIIRKVCVAETLPKV